MTGVGLVIAIGLAIWLTLLTLMVVLLVRQVALLELRLSVGAPKFSIAADGPRVGAEVPERVRNSLIGGGSLRILVLSAGCSPCRELLPALIRISDRDAPTVLLAGSGQAADAFADMIPPKLNLVRDPLARELTRDLSVMSTPFLVEVSGTRVSGKAYVRNSADLERLLSSPLDESRTDPNQALEKGVSHVV